MGSLFLPTNSDVASAVMRVITVKEPWATLIVRHGKNVENRPRNIAGSYRGPVAIHAALRATPAYDPAWQVAAAVGMNTDRRNLHPGRIIGVVDLVDVTPPAGNAAALKNTSPWGADGHGPTDWCLPDCWHLHLDNPHALDAPIPYTGAIALRRLEPHVAAQILTQLEDAGVPPRARAWLADAG